LDVGNLTFSDVQVKSPKYIVITQNLKGQFQEPQMVKTFLHLINSQLNCSDVGAEFSRAP
jgi:hypothetical protein